MKLLVYIGLMLFVVELGAQLKDLSAVDLLQRMDSSISANQELTFNFIKRERVNDGTDFSESIVKVQNTDVFRVFMRSNYPREGLEILYADGQNDNQVLVNTNTFPYFNLDIDPLGSLIRSDQHHTIFDLGFTTLQTLYRDFVKEHSDSLEQFLIRKENVYWKGDSLYKVWIDYPDFGYRKYTVKKGEDVDIIAKNLGVSAYMILMINENIDDYDEVEAGDVIWVPNNYSRRCELYIHPTTFLPLRQLIFDDKGIYEHYEYMNVNTRPNFKPNELTRDFEEYGF